MKNLRTGTNQVINVGMIGRVTQGFEEGPGEIGNRPQIAGNALKL